MPAMLRRRAGFLGKMALEVAYECLDGRSRPSSDREFCSRHGDVARAVDLLATWRAAKPLSPTAFGMAVHNAIPGLLTIARADRANHIALAAGAATIEHAVIEACGLLADGAPWCCWWLAIARCRNCSSRSRNAKNSRMPGRG
jgi:hypothetical protein